MDYEIHFSNDSGFYDHPFPLKIEGGGRYDIFYTLDGSEPTRNSIAYHPGDVITIADASENENILSKRTDISAGYSEYASNPHSFAVPEKKVDKCTIVRASVISKNGDILQSIQGVYFVGFQNKQAYQNVYVASIVADHEDLFGYETGILVTGETFDTYVQGGTDENGIFVPYDWFAPTCWRWPANYTNTGKEWEREAQITVFDTQGALTLDQLCGIRIHGGRSRGYPCRSIRFYARKEYAGQEVFPAGMFGEGIDPHVFMLYSGGDDYAFSLKDYIGQSLAQPLDFATQEFIPCCLFVNGEYWGFYFLSEHYNKNYISDHYDVAEDNVIMMKKEELKEGANSDLQFFHDMREFISTNDMSVAKNYRKACELIDIDSYIDYYAFEMYIANTDWPLSNYALWRTRKPEDSPMGDCKWRWMLFDLNLGAMSPETLEFDALNNVLKQDAMFRSLWNSPEFRNSFSERILEIGKTVLNADTCVKFINDYDAAFRGQVALNNERFFNSPREVDYLAYLEGMRTFFTERYSVVEQFLADHMEQ